MTIPARLLVHTVTKVRPAAGTPDAHNNVDPDYGPAATRTSIIGRLIQQSAAETYAEGRDADEETWVLLTNDLDLVSSDRIEWASHPARGAVTFEVQGPPMPKHDGEGPHHTRAPLRILTG